MTNLQVFLFGCMRIVPGGWPAPVQVSHSDQSLLAYLLLQRHRSHSRELLAGLIWGDHSQERARCCLNTALWRLRHVLEPDGISRGTYLLTTSRGEVGFNRESDYWLDVSIFETRANQVLTRPIETLATADVQDLEQALQLCTGELLEGHYDDWVLHERERLRRLDLNALAHLMHYYQYHGVFEKSLACAQQILDQDPLREEIHREMMELYLKSGQRALAVRQFELCRELLASELGICPMDETQELCSQILAGASSDQGRSTPMRPPPGCQQALQQLRRAVQHFSEAQEQLLQAIQLIERFVEVQNSDKSCPTKPPDSPPHESRPRSNPLHKYSH